MKEYMTNCPNYHHNVGGGILSWAVVRQDENGKIFARRVINAWHMVGWKEVEEAELQPYEKAALAAKIYSPNGPANF